MRLSKWGCIGSYRDWHVRISEGEYIGSYRDWHLRISKWGGYRHVNGGI